MRVGRWRFTRRQTLTLLSFLLLVAPIPLAYISKHDNIESPTSGSSDAFGWLWLLIGAVVLALALRGNVSALTFCAWVYILISLGSIVGSFVAPNGPFQLASAGIIGLATAVVFLLIRTEAEAGQRSLATSASVDATESKATT